MHTLVIVSQGEVEQAKLELLGVIKLVPDHLQAHSELGTIYKQLGDKTAALRGVSGCIANRSFVKTCKTGNKGT